MNEWERVNQQCQSVLWKRITLSHRFSAFWLRSSIGIIISCSITFPSLVPLRRTTSNSHHSLGSYPSIAKWYTYTTIFQLMNFRAHLWNLFMFSTSNAILLTNIILSLCLLPLKITLVTLATYIYIFDFLFNQPKALCMIPHSLSWGATHSHHILRLCTLMKTSPFLWVIILVLQWHVLNILQT